MRFVKLVIPIEWQGAIADIHHLQIFAVVYLYIELSLQDNRVGDAQLYWW